MSSLVLFQRISSHLLLRWFACQLGARLKLKLEAIATVQPELGPDFKHLKVTMDRDLGSDTLHVKMLPYEQQRYEIPRYLFPEPGVNSSALQSLTKAYTCKNHPLTYIICSCGLCNCWRMQILLMTHFFVVAAGQARTQKQLRIMLFVCKPRQRGQSGFTSSQMLFKHIIR